ncbi:hypothetical protein [Ralstonia mojiangensis]|uniref:hypothetical protein n=1 Tax=Ralstonia mojiangensis TaxID=2953895 RepID=UPI00209101CF|nr:hypothetical protein [Ralstonia mojiangensis]
MPSFNSLACPFGVLAIACAAQAAPISKECDMKLRLDVPTAVDLEVIPIGWDPRRPQFVNWDASRMQFKPLTRRLNLKSGVGDVQAKFGSTDDPRLTHADDEEAFYVLGVKVEDKNIGTESVVVVARADAKDGKDVSLTVTPVPNGKMANGPRSGYYSSEFPLVFETVIE